MSNESTLVLIKPDGVNRALIGKVIEKLESTGLKITGMKLILIDKDLASKHYEEHKDKPFFSSLVNFITSSPVVALALNGENAIQKTRTMMGSTNPLESSPGTIRGDFGLSLEKNVIHGSANENDALREIKLYFSEEEIINYDRSVDNWVS
ncbi:MAG: nucleoside-diphosphate kinase [Dehalococcoidia bacterium]|nr:nucleoside-diphosphate kinase [Dehalococcoidia bacterium]|tara:strand:+ start:2425 stop:2877 length:453 start_codon:yes stop_codon:yes gene_type:complete